MRNLKKGVPGNAKRLVMPVGHPPIFATAEAIQKEIEKYFEHIKGEIEQEASIGEGGIEVEQKWKRPPEYPSITGLALYLGFESRQSFYDYEGRGEFSYTVKRARLKIEAFYEQGLNKSAPTGSIFALKNFGWKDKQEIMHEGIPENKTPLAPVINVYNTAPPLAEAEDSIS